MNETERKWIQKGKMKLAEDENLKRKRAIVPILLIIFGVFGVLGAIAVLPDWLFINATDPSDWWYYEPEPAHYQDIRFVMILGGFFIALPMAIIGTYQLMRVRDYNKLVDQQEFIDLIEARSSREDTESRLSRAQDKIDLADAKARLAQADAESRPRSRRLSRAAGNITTKGTITNNNDVSIGNYCEQCGNKVGDGSFCKHCGAKLN